MRYSFASPQGFGSPSSLKTSKQHSAVNIGVLKHLRTPTDHRRGRRCHTSIATLRPSAEAWVTFHPSVPKTGTPGITARQPGIDHGCNPLLAVGWPWVTLGGNGCT